MAEDIRDKLRRQLAGSTPKGLPGQEPRRLVDKGTGPAPEEKKVPMYMPVDVYLIRDGTSSTEPIHKAIEQGLDEIAKELLEQEDRGEIKISIGVVRDHYDTLDVLDLVRVEHFGTRPSLRPMPASDYLQVHPLSGDLRELRRRISGIECIANADDAEAYECGWLEVAKRITNNPQRKGRKQVAVFFGDMVPHRARDPKPYIFETTGPRGSYRMSDFGCPHGIDSVTAWRALDAATDLALFVGCTEYGVGYAASRYKGYGVDTLQRKIVEAARGERNTSKFVPLQDIGDIPALIMAGTRLAQSEAAFREYAQRQLTDSGRRDRIAGYLEMKKP